MFEREEGSPAALEPTMCRWGERERSEGSRARSWDYRQEQERLRAPHGPSYSSPNLAQPGGPQYYYPLEYSDKYNKYF